jgi:hypothetical protein
MGRMVKKQEGPAPEQSFSCHYKHWQVELQHFDDL